MRAVCSSRAREHAPEEDSLAYAQRHGAVHQAVISDRYLQSDQLPFLRESEEQVEEFAGEVKES